MPTTEERETAVRAILANETTGVAVAKSFGLTPQAVSLWVQRYRAHGTLKPQKNGRPALHRPDAKERVLIWESTIRWFEERGFYDGDVVPRSKRPTREELSEMITEWLGKKISPRQAAVIAHKMGFPLNDGKPPTKEYPDYPKYPHVKDHLYPVKKIAVIKRNRKDTVTDEELDAEYPERVDPGDDMPKTMEEYEEWVEETRALIKKQKQKNARNRHGVRVGKHAKGKIQQKKKRRKKGKKKRR